MKKFCRKVLANLIIIVLLISDILPLGIGIVSYAEENCKPLFEKEEDGTIKFVIIVNDSLKYRREYLEQDGYEREKAEDYDNYVYPQEINVTVDLPKADLRFVNCS